LHKYFTAQSVPFLKSGQTFVIYDLWFASMA